MNTSAIFERIKAAAIEDWQRYVDHEFIRQMEAGTLAQAVFQQYLIQDYLFLIQYARAYALAIYKSPTLEDMQLAQGGLNAILGEMHLHIRLCEGWGLKKADLIAAPEHAATIAYTRYVLDCGQRGDLLDLHVALAPCMIGYAEIGRRLAPALAANPNHPYREWISEYASEGFQQAAQASINHMQQLADRALTEARFLDIVAIFSKASQLEADFWQMGFDLAREKN
ncbi:thiaminase II [Lampropedia puyangensis]|uniref:Aminopyrimidine aminohydrolase n=1 Tax=Lampropedia puyangensis TaxID=1330072 RepID=A0A4S8F0U5_9BURK|nr:thiaminase II [Lampropedia puyangensis]THU00261.1 thiaminase II [Lampropedia puyangensis]